MSYFSLIGCSISCTLLHSTQMKQPRPRGTVSMPSGNYTSAGTSTHLSPSGVISPTLQTARHLRRFRESYPIRYAQPSSQSNEIIVHSQYDHSRRNRKPAVPRQPGRTRTRQNAQKNTVMINKQIQQAPRPSTPRYTVIDLLIVNEYADYGSTEIPGFHRGPKIKMIAVVQNYDQKNVTAAAASICFGRARVIMCAKTVSFS